MSRAAVCGRLQERAEEEAASVAQGAGSRSLGERLRAAKRAAGLTWDALAERTRLGRTTLYDLGAGRGGPPTTDTVKAIARVLKVNPGWLAYGDEGEEA